MNIDPKKMQAMMKQMGINQKEIDALRVIIETESENIIIEDPSVIEINMQGNKSWQVNGDSHIEEKGVNENDVKIVMEKAGVSEHDARKALEKANGDLSEAILELSE